MNDLDQLGADITKRFENIAALTVKWQETSNSMGAAASSGNMLGFFAALRRNAIMARAVSDEFLALAERIEEATT